VRPAAQRVGIDAGAMEHIQDGPHVPFLTAVRPAGDGDVRIVQSVSLGRAGEQEARGLHGFRRGPQIGDVFRIAHGPEYRPGGVGNHAVAPLQALDDIIPGCRK
jgi:hypothetical protein